MLYLQRKTPSGILKSCEVAILYQSQENEGKPNDLQHAIYLRKWKTDNHWNLKAAVKSQFRLQGLEEQNKRKQERKRKKNFKLKFIGLTRGNRQNRILILLWKARVKCDRDRKSQRGEVCQWCYHSPPSAVQLELEKVSSCSRWTISLILEIFG